MQVNAKTLREKVERLEGFRREHFISLDGEYQLKAYRMLLDYMDKYAELQERYDLDVNPEGK